MSSDEFPDLEREQRYREAQKKWSKDRLDRVRASLLTHVGRTIWLDVTSTATQLAPRVLGLLVAVRDDEIEVVDMSDASLPPSQKPRRTIALASIRDWRQS